MFVTGFRDVRDVAAEQAKVDPMYQFTIEPLAGSGGWEIAGYNTAFTNSALWMLITTVVLFLFVLGGMKRELVPGRWQMVVESFTGFIDDMLEANIGKEGRKYVPYVFSLFMFILFANLLGLMPLGVFGLHPFTLPATSPSPACWRSSASRSCCWWVSGSTGCTSSRCSCPKARRCR